MSCSSQFHVGTTVRASHPDPAKSSGSGRATIATIQDTTACVLWEPLSPKAFSTSISGSKKGPKRRLKRSFLVTPWIKPQESQSSEQDTEATVDVKDLKVLLDFEKDLDTPMVVSEDGDEITLWKERGDQLLRLGDPSSACSYYETALRLSSILQVGSSVIVREGGHAKVADVDCLDDDDEDCIEITVDETGEEKVVKEKEICLCILYNDAEAGHRQERILLNLARCLLQLAEVAKHQEMASERRPRYLKSTVLAATLVLTIADHHKKDSDDEIDKDDASASSFLTSLEQTALLLRSQAQVGIAKFPNAISDIKRLLGSIPGHKEGLKQMKSITLHMHRQKQVEKNLIKSMCKLVQQTTTENPVSNAEGGTLEEDCGNEASNPLFIIIVYNLVVYLILPVLFAYFLQNMVS